MLGVMWLFVDAWLFVVVSDVSAGCYDVIRTIENSENPLWDLNFPEFNLNSFLDFSEKAFNFFS